MKVCIGPYKNWFGPYQLAEKLMFWVPKEKDEYGFERTANRVHNFGEWLAHGSVEPDEEVGSITSWNKDRHITWIYKFLLWVDSKKKRKIKIHIDKWDIWSMDHTLAEIILPMLKQLKATQHGSHIVDLEDVPEYMRTDTHYDYDAQQCFEFYFDKMENENKTGYDTHDRWTWVIDEMIFAFEHHVDDSWEEQYRSGDHDLQWKKLENGMSEMIRGPGDTYKCDYDAIEKINKRMGNGFRLFGKYYRGLWD